MNSGKKSLVREAIEIRSKAGYRVPVKYLATWLNIHPSTVRKYVVELVREGYPIASDSKGYWIMQSKKEMQEYLNKLQKVQVALSERIADAYHAYEHNYFEH